VRNASDAITSVSPDGRGESDWEGKAPPHLVGRLSIRLVIRTPAERNLEYATSEPGTWGEKKKRKGGTESIMDCQRKTIEGERIRE